MSIKANNKILVKLYPSTAAVELKNYPKLVLKQKLK